jgi:hypothetical protein
MTPGIELHRRIFGEHCLNYETVQNTNVHLLDWRQFQELFAERWCRDYCIPNLRQSGGADHQLRRNANE